MADQKAIQAKIRSVGNIKKITRAMEMIARTKMQRRISSVLSIRPYALYAQQLLLSLSKEEGVESPYLSAGQGSKTLAVVIASDKGLCGGYNSSIGRLLRSYVTERSNLEVVCIGKRARAEAKKLKLPVRLEFIDLPDQLTLADAEKMGEAIEKLFVSGEYASVEVVYTDYVSSFSQKVKVRPLLPISKELLEDLVKASAFEEEKEEKLEAQSLALYTFEPSAGAIIDSIVPTLINASILHSLLESKASEESMRMFAMKSATENANKLQSDLTLSYNRARQQGITQEIAEIAGGAEALN